MESNNTLPVASSTAIPNLAGKILPNCVHNSANVLKAASNKRKVNFLND